MKKILSLMLTVVITLIYVPNVLGATALPDFSNPAPIYDTDSVLNAPLSTTFFPYDSRSRAVSLIGDGGSAYLAKGDAFFAKGGKYTYSEFGYSPYFDGEYFMIPAPLVAAAFDLQFSQSGNVCTLGGALITANESTYVLNEENKSFSCAPKILKNVLYIPFEDAIKTICGKNLYFDGRMYLVSVNEITLTNSPSSEKILEPIDVIYRFLMFDRPDGNIVYNDINQNMRPKILTTPAKLADTKSRIAAQNDGIVNYWYYMLLNSAEALLNSDFQEYTVVSGSLTDCARNVLEKIKTLSSAYLLSGDVRYAQRCHAEMLNALNWEQWNATETQKNGKTIFSGHYLGLSELTRAMAIGFDSLYNYLDDTEKSYIIEKTIAHSLSYSLKCYQITSHDYYQGSEWRYSEGNWGAVCSSAIISACIAFKGEENAWLSENAAYLLGEAIHSLEYPLMLFYPDGAWYEGLSYWGYATDYLFGAAIYPIYNSTGKTYSLLNPEGVKDALNSVMYLQTAENGTFNYADASNKTIFHAVGFLICDLLGDSSLTESWINFSRTANNSGTILSLMYYHPESNRPAKALPLDKYFKSAEAGVMKTSWERGGSYVGIKGGQNNTNHDNLDLGTFVYESQGVRWASELGSDNYHISGGYWGTNGYELYVKRPEGQNCLVINPREDIENEMYGGQYLNAYAPLIKSASGDKGAYMVLDLSDAYKYDTEEYIRGYYFGDDRNTLTIKDELTLLKNNSEIYWFMHTEADISISSDGKSATLTDSSGKKLSVTAALSDGVASWHFEEREVAPFESSPVREGQLSGEYSKEEFSKLTLVAIGSGNIEISVKLADEGSYTPAIIEKISNWTIPDGHRENMASFLNVYDKAKISENTEKIYVKTNRSFSSASILANGKKIAELGEGTSGINEFLIFENAFRNMESCTLSLLLDNIPACDDISVYISEPIESEPSFNIDFDTYSDNISASYNIEPHPGESSEIFISNGVLNIKSQSGKSSYLQKSFRCNNGVAEICFDTSVESYGGLISFEPKLTSNETDRNFYFDGNSNTITIFSSKTLGKSSVYIIPGAKYHISIILDLDAGHYQVYAESNHILEKTLISYGTMQSCDPESIRLDTSYFRLNFRNYYSDSVPEMLWSIDNISAKKALYAPVLPSIESTSFERDGVISHSQYSVVPFNAEKIMITLDTALQQESITKETVALSHNGSPCEVDNIIYDNNSVIISGAKLLPHVTYTVTLSKDVKNSSGISFGREADLFILSGDENLLCLSASLSEENGNYKATVTGTNGSGQSISSCTIALATYKDGAIAGFKVLSDKTFSPSPEEEKEITLPSSGTDNAKIFIWDKLF